MSKRPVKCYGYCNESYPKEVMIKYKNKEEGKGDGKNHCPTCYPMRIKEVADREDLYSFIKAAYNLNFPTGNILRQIKTFKEERGYTYKNMKFTLDYIFNIKKTAQPITKFGIALVPHYYDEMIAYYKDLQERREKTVVTEQKVITIKMKPFKMENTYREKKLINMEDLLK